LVVIFEQRGELEIRLVSIGTGQDRRIVVARALGMDGHLQLHRPPAIEKFAMPESTTKHAGASVGKHGSPGASHQAPPVTSPRTVSKHPMPTSPRCLCSPTTHAGSFRCRLHRGITGGSVGAGLPEMGKKPGV
jgi:hypothetical protein